jgi:glycosyltransferase involved in cell wall biosynthesis
MIACIATKGRPKTITYKLFAEQGYEVYHFIEPQDFDAYDVPNKVNIGDNDRGLSFARNFIFDWARERTEWVWMCDDDVQGFGTYKNGKTVRDGSIVLETIAEKAVQLPFEIVGMNYVQHAWYEKTPYSVNKKFADVCCLMNVRKLRWPFEGRIKVDRDYMMQTIVNGNGVLRFNHIWFSCPDVGTNAGGLHELYASKEDQRTAERMALKWDPWVTLKYNGDRLDMRCDLAGLAKHYGKQVK